ncbi:non-reducing end alpha-L-arabinofuranosidase family hydrolase [Opitutus terrae]|uniref:non-reducing end alpha-L-arabinofuranosidase n=1 Tax=Opitutus terrae (strain DSM 11246 / JCM 15787 / PB90-1) TaxID=452637 RepID=B1ZQD7_OPITP|nr:non-reducing end alpha-L-arabinofuranosidase family hydrolase [Opitutus terrae]ACB73617.1 Alpha-N-arabinofuranosidase [Opitutus terrae PB90-1]
MQQRPPLAWFAWGFLLTLAPLLRADGLTGPFFWTSTAPLIAPVADATHPIVSMKDPTVVYHGGKWHVYATTADTSGNWSMTYLSFRTWAEASAARPYYLDQNPNLRGYHCAPQVFYFRPQQKWYLIYQSQHPTYSTADDLSKPETWTAPQSFFNGTPSTVVQGWIDYWIICDDTHAYLFFSDDYGRFYRSRTRVENFPRGFEDPVVVMQDANRFNLFEGGCVYRLKGLNQYLCLIECIGGPTGKRYFRAFTADRLDGTWTPLAQANSWDTPFAGPMNVTADDGRTLWSVDISHGELLRDSNDETMTLDPSRLYFLYQGRRELTPDPSYSQLPYQLALLQSDRATRAADSPPGAVLSVTAPQNTTAAIGGSATFSVTATGTGSLVYQWQRNGADLPGATGPSLALPNVQSANAGLYTVVVSNGVESLVSAPASLHVTLAGRVVGTAVEFRSDVHHPNGNIYDQMLLTGAAASVTADPGQIVRTSYIDTDDDIVQVEFSGAGTLSLTLDSASAPARPTKYNQAIDYVKGHAAIVVTGANETTHLSVFSVGRATAVDQSLFRDDVNYDGFADLAYVTIASANGRFGGLRAGNAGFRAAKGLTGIYAPGVQFDGPVYVHDITAFDSAAPVLQLGGASDVRITGGNLAQDNGRAVAVSGVDRLQFTAGSNSHGALLSQQPNRSRLERHGLDVTGLIATAAWDFAPQPMTPLSMDDITIYAMSQSVHNETDPQLLELRPDISFRTWMRWKRYGIDPPEYAFPYIADAHAAGIRVLGGTTATVVFREEFTAEEFEQIVTRDAEGNLVPHDNVEAGAHRASLANPAYRAYLEALCRHQIDGGVDGLFFDEVNHGYDGATYDNNEGFDDYHLADFNAYLLAKYPRGTDFAARFQMTADNLLRHDLPPGDLRRNFNYRRYLAQHGWSRTPLTSANPLAAEWGHPYDDQPEPGARTFVSTAEPYRYFGEMVRNLKTYAWEKYQRPLLVTANGILPKVDFQSVGLWNSNRFGDNGTEAEWVPVIDGHLNGRASLQSVFRRFRARSELLAPGAPVVVFLDWPTATLNRYTALPQSEREDFWRIYAAEAYANGIFFAFHLKTTTGEPTASAQGMMPFFKTYAAFYRAHADLYHHLTAWPSESQIVVAQAQIMTATWQQSEPRRLLVHLVNHDYDRGLKPRSNVTITLPLASPPRAVREASPDLSQDRALSYSHADGKLTVTLPQLTAYSVVIVDY